MSLKKLKKLCCGLLASAGVISSSGVVKAAIYDTKDVEKSVSDVVVSSSNAADQSGDLGNSAPDKVRGVVPISYIPSKPVSELDLLSPGKFETERLLIDDDFSAEDIKILLDLYDESVSKWMSKEGHSGKKLSAKQKLESIFPQRPMGGASVSFVVRNKETGSMPIGVVTASVYPTGVAKFSYWLAKESRGKGYAAEAMKEFSSRMFAHPGIKTVGVRVYDDNHPSLKVKDKIFKNLNELYPNNFLKETITPENGDKISHHLISKFYFDFEEDTSLNDGHFFLEKVEYESLIDAFSYLLNEKNEVNLPSDVKQNLKIKLENLKSGDLKVENSSYFYVVTELPEDKKSRTKSAGFVCLNTCKFKDSSSDLFEVSYINDEGKLSNDHNAAPICLLLAKNILCGTTESKIKVKLQNGNTSLVKELSSLLEKDPASKILKVSMEKDDDGHDSLFIEKKANSNVKSTTNTVENDSTVK